MFVHRMFLASRPQKDRNKPVAEKKLVADFPTDYYIIDPFLSISAAQAAEALPSFAGPKEGSKKRAWESLACPLRFQNAIPAAYVKLPQQGPNNCDTVGI